MSKANFLHIIKSVFAAAIGVQNNKNREQDFQSGSVWPYIAGGIIFVILFVLLIAFVVSSVLS